MACIHEIAETIADLGVGLETPVVENPDDLAVDWRRLTLLDDERAIKAAANLLEAALVRVIPVGPGIRHVELVNEAVAGSDRRLRQMWHPVHRIRHAQPVPVDCGRLCELVLDEAPPNPREVNVFVNDEVVPRLGDDGWELDDSTSPPTIVIKGETCAVIETQGVQSVLVEFGCPTIDIPK